MRKEQVTIGLLGLGTVGRGVYRVLCDNGALITRRLGVPLEIKKILVRDLQKDRGLYIPPSLLTTNPSEVLDDPEIDIIVEVMGGMEPTLSYVLQGLRNGKSVITANKDMVAAYGRELFAAAQRTQRDFLFEASVAGGIPIIRVLKECLVANYIQELIGIVNGTTNYILSKMTLAKVDFAQALAEAQALGYAEQDPTNDIDGFDAARKMAILGSIAFNSRISLEDVYVEGIRNIKPADIQYAAELGYVIKLLGIAKNTPDGVDVRVHPALLPCTHPLAAVNDVFNAVFVKGDAVGEAMFFGRGAGELPTASAVVADIVYAARNLIHNVPGMLSCTCFEDRHLRPIEAVPNKYYLRLVVLDRPGVLAQIAFIFGEHEVSLASVIQKSAAEGKAEIVLVTHRVAEGNLRRALKLIGELPVVDAICSVIRVEGEED